MLFFRKLKTVFVSFFFLSALVFGLDALSYRHWKNVEFFSKRANLTGAKSSVQDLKEGEGSDLLDLVKKLEEERNDAQSFFDKLVELAKDSGGE